MHVPQTQDLQQLFELKYGDTSKIGWSPRRRSEFGYFLPAEHYEALVNNLVTPETEWIDIGGGGALFPDNKPLSQLLSQRARKLVAVDPSDNLDSNPYAQERAKCMIEDYRTDAQFDLATFRMVAEHITNPASVVTALNRLLRPHGKVVIFTVNRWAPVTVVSSLVPFGLHHPIKKLFWGGEEEDTFPTAYRMNTREQLRAVFAAGGFEERDFAYVDDLSVFSRFKTLNYLELMAWRGLKSVGMRYPENCLLGVYEKVGN